MCLEMMTLHLIVYNQNQMALREEDVEGDAIYIYYKKQ